MPSPRPRLVLPLLLAIFAGCAASQPALRPADLPEHVAESPIVLHWRIDREAERLATKRAAELGIGPKVAAMFEDPACLVTCFVEGRELTPEELRGQEALIEVARGLRSFHDSGLELPTRFHVQEIVREYAGVARSRGGALPDEFEGSLARADEIVAALALPARDPGASAD